ncbi:uncharacterized protein HMPREF1541_03818 [Cyphellophora europaea CBS 101466]|uniref:Anaphase-promoting complex subunit 4 WD40 domain-containing protein n=1 Tax=Cyphellophora europaea (strain CBS 101466) TaxID=1220924 RepID=W2S1R4_CYPE1|nr:uncharacterized protein HMPREF1541_03818 [Cyphellophora europaea CBS 101466]ETN41879.1 hypothetical protein HMPREF1541_03818 [Cyphellophora europaea CBS 101466]
MSSNQYPIADPPTDAISAIRFSPQPDSVKFVSSSWDKHVYLYELTDGKFCTKLKKFEHRAPVLDVCFGQDDNTIFTACLDQSVRRIDTATGQQTILSTHEKGVKSVVYCKEYDLVISAAWDSTMHLHPGTPTTWETATIVLPAKPFSLALSPSKLVVAMAARAVNIYELKTLAHECQSLEDPSQAVLKTEAWQRRESSLKFMTRTVDCMPNDEGYATSSIEGRVAVEWFDPSTESQARKYAFKCHRQPIEEVDVVYPVNAIAFHPIHGTFATGGGDGVVAIWDAVAKRRIRIYPKLAASVASLSFSSNGKFLAIAVCPELEEGMDDLPAEPVSIMIRELGENEVKRKAAK